MFRHHRHISTAVALVVALVAAPSAASARPFQPIATPPSSQTQTPSADSPHSREAANPSVRAIQAQAARVAHQLAKRDALAGRATLSPPPVSIVTVFQPNGFDWGDAGIGAGATLGLILILLGSTLYLTHRNTPRASQPR
ncbi:MAG TPA: hypothetical protein VFI54_06795 [Solirubrobacteraceae bacterium]|nr:hypothetical protein [Solirubrobacteraceae bacterium]